MTRVVRNAALFCVAGILVASAAVANVPDPAHSTLAGPYIDVGGLSPGAVPDLCTDGICQDFTLTVRDFANNPVANATVVVDFSTCLDAKIKAAQVGRNQATQPQTALCPKQVQGVTNATGQVTLSIEGAAFDHKTAGSFDPIFEAGGAPCAQIYANGVALSSGLFVAFYDVDGVSSAGQAVNSADVSVALGECAQAAAGGNKPARLNVARLGVNLTVVNSVDSSVYLSMGAQRLVGTGSSDTSPFCP